MGLSKFLNNKDNYQKNFIVFSLYKLYKNIILWRNLKFHFFWTFFRNKKVQSINNFEYKKYTQNFEDGIIQIIFHKIGTTNKFSVEFGVENGSECNTRKLREEGWNTLMMDCNDNLPEHVKNEYITADNINQLFVKYNVPREFDLLSIDVDSNDYWIWERIVDYNPRVVCMEYNASFPPPISKSIAYDPNYMWDRTDYMGASLTALNKLAVIKGYTLIGCDSIGVNAFFVRNDLVQNHFQIKSEKDFYRKPGFGEFNGFKRLGHKKNLTKKMVDI
jgi:hypothetical protein